MSKFSIAFPLTYELSRLVYTYCNNTWDCEMVNIWGPEDGVPFTGVTLIFDGSTPADVPTKLTTLLNNLNTISSEKISDEPLTYRFSGFTPGSTIGTFILTDHLQVLVNGDRIATAYEDEVSVDGTIDFIFDILLDGSAIEMVAWNKNDPSQNGIALRSR